MMMRNEQPISSAIHDINIAIAALGTALTAMERAVFAVNDPQRPSVGCLVYHVYYEEKFPEQACVTEWKVGDVSQLGMIYSKADDDWYDFYDPENRLYLSKEIAEAKLKELAEGKND